MNLAGLKISSLLAAVLTIVFAAFGKIEWPYAIIIVVYLLEIRLRQ